MFRATRSLVPVHIKHPLNGPNLSQLYLNKSAFFLGVWYGKGFFKWGIAWEVSLLCLSNLCNWSFKPSRVGGLSRNCQGLCLESTSCVEPRGAAFFLGGFRNAKVMSWTSRPSKKRKKRILIFTSCFLFLVVVDSWDSCHWTMASKEIIDCRKTPLIRLDFILATAWFRSCTTWPKVCYRRKTYLVNWWWRPKSCGSYRCGRVWRLGYTYNRYTVGILIKMGHLLGTGFSDTPKYHIVGECSWCVYIYISISHSIPIPISIPMVFLVDITRRLYATMDKDFV